VGAQAAQGLRARAQVMGTGRPESGGRSTARRCAADRRGVGGVRLRLPDLRAGIDGRDRPVSRAALPRRRIGHRGAAGHGTDRADLRSTQRHRGNRVALRHLLRAGNAAHRFVHETGEVVGAPGDDR
jgi:hypothetical protein